MKLSIAFAGAVFCAILGMTEPAAAANAVTTHDLNMRVAPGAKYPRITTIPAHSVVTVHGCVRNWTWCDTSWWRYRGWVSARYLRAIYHGRPQYMPHYGPRIGVPIITFHFGTYWDRWYHGRPIYRHHPWYDDGPFWERRWYERW